jgi:hypothetical protein
MARHASIVNMTTEYSFLTPQEQRIEQNPQFSPGILEGFITAFEQINPEIISPRVRREGPPESDWVPLTLGKEDDSLSLFSNDNLEMKVTLDPEKFDNYITKLQMRVQIQDEDGLVVEQLLTCQFLYDTHEAYIEGKFRSVRSKTYADRREHSYEVQSGKHYRGLAKSLMFIWHHEVRSLMNRFPDLFDQMNVISHLEDVSTVGWSSEVAKELGHKPEGGPLGSIIEKASKLLDSRNPRNWIYTYQKRRKD